MNLFERWKKTTVANKALVASSFLMAFGTLFYAGAAIVQVCIMKRSAREGSAQTAKLIEAAKAQACAAQKIADASGRNAAAAESFSTSADKIREETAQAVGEFTRLANSTEKNIRQAQESLRDEERAWVGVHARDLDYDGPGPVPHINIQMRNTGRTPAFKVKQFVNNIITACCGPTFAYTTPKVVETPDKGTITPDAFISLGYHAEWLNTNNIVSFSGGRQTAIISGKVAYEDAYRRKHFTNYCFYYIVGLGGPGGTIFPRSAKFCPYGNDTDDDPEPPPKAGTMIEYP